MNGERRGMQGRDGKYSKGQKEFMSGSWTGRGGDEGDMNEQGNGAGETDGGRRPKDTVKWAVE